MTDDEMTSRLAQLRADLLAAAADADGATITTVLFRLGMALGVADTAMKAVDAALGFHERVGLYGNASTEEEPGNCPHDPDSRLHFEDGDGSGEWLCEGRPEGAVRSEREVRDGVQHEDALQQPHRTAPHPPRAVRDEQHHQAVCRGLHHPC